MVSMSDELKECNILKLILIVARMTRENTYTAHRERILHRDSVPTFGRAGIEEANGSEGVNCTTGRLLGGDL
jgi:hypothetical protein